LKHANMELWATFFLGLAGSLHCAGMCGPLVLAAAGNGRTTTGHVLGRVAYNAGRVATYGLLGAVFGLIGGTLVLVGIARWVSIGAGVSILLSVLSPARFSAGGWATKPSAWIRAPLVHLLRQRGLTSGFLLGLCNGLLPCGLVYAACAASAASGRPLAGAACMLVFGLGTVPMMLGIGLFGIKLQSVLRLRFQKFIPAFLVLVGLVLILRGALSGMDQGNINPSASSFHCPLCR
jgi:uncharacterized protein